VAVRQRALALGLAGALLAAGFFALPRPASAGSTLLATTVEPSAGFGFLYTAVLAAHHSIDLSMYELTDATFDKDLANRASAKVDVKVLLDSDYDIKSVNAPAAAYLRAHHVHVAWAPSDQIFHAKYLVIDDQVLYIGTGNLTPKYYTSTRDFWVTDRIAADVTVASETFAADFAGRSPTLTAHSEDLIWSPGSTSSLVNLIDVAKHTLLVENEEMDSTKIEAALAKAAARHVRVEIVMTYASTWTAALKKLVKEGVSVRVLHANQVYIHAKVICADCTGTGGTVFVGSQNFSTSSLVYNRELGIITSSRAVVGPVRTAVAADFAQGSSTL
jgi:cardiolipin synthase A/B